MSAVTLQHLRAGDLDEALATLGAAADLDVPLRKGFDNGYASAAGALHRRLSTLDSDERYELLRKWSLPTESRQTVRVLEAFVPTVAPPAVFARAFGERPRASSFPIANVGDVSGLFSTAWQLVVAADDAGRLRLLTVELERLVEQEIPNSKHVLTLAKIVGRKRYDQTLQADLTAYLAMVVDHSPRPFAKSSTAFDEAWQYGYGEFDADTDRTVRFEPLAVWSDAAWQQTLQTPDRSHQELGLLRIDRTGGHPGNEQACIRRWIAPADGVVLISGTLHPPANSGDGVQARIVSSRDGLCGACRAFNRSETTEVGPLQVAAGDSIDFVVSKNATTTNDSFEWMVRLVLQTAAGDLRYDSTADFCGPSEKHVLADAVIATACLEREGLQAIGQNILAELIEHTYEAETSLQRDPLDSYSSMLRPALRRAWATAIVKQIGARESHLLNDVPLQHWLPSNAGHRSGNRRQSMWFAREDQILHLAGSGNDLLLFKYPLMGEFQFACDAQVGGRPRTNGSLAYGGLSFGIDDADQPLASARSSVAGEAAVPNDDVDRPEFQRITLSVADDRVRFFAGEQTTWPDAAKHRAAPWLALRSRADLAPIFRRFKLTGDPVIPREVRMSEGDSLRGWFAASGGAADWFAKGGVIHSARRNSELAREIQPSTHDLSEEKARQAPVAKRHLCYIRPLLDGESISYDFRYEPGKQEVHPALGRLAFIVEPSGVRLHWMTDGAREWTGLAEDNSIVELFDRRGPKPLPFVLPVLDARPVGGEGEEETAWNRMMIAIQGDRVALSLNGSLIYQRKLAPHDDRTFGFYHDANRSGVQVKDVVLRGDWPQRLTSQQFDDLAVASDHSQSNADRRALDYLFGEPSRAQSIMEVARQAASLSGETRYDYLASWVLSEQSRSAIRMWGTFAPLPAPPLVDQPLLGLPSPIESSPAEANRHLAGAQLIAPAIEFVAVAKQLGRLDRIRERVRVAAGTGTNGLNADDESHQQALLALVNIAANDFQAAIANLGVLVAAASRHEAEQVDHWPEMVAAWVALRHPATNEVGRELIDVMFERLRLGQLGRSDAWKRHLTALAEVARFENELVAFGQTVLTEPLEQWRSVSHVSARSRGQGFPSVRWQRLPQRVNIVSAHDRDYLYFQSPLRGDFRVECEVASTLGQQKGHLAYGGTFTFAWDSLSHYGAGNFREQTLGGLATRFDPKLTRPETWMRYRLVVQDGRVQVYFNGRLVREHELPEDHDPWLAVRNHWERTGAVRDVRITGDPIIPETIALATSADLPGWLPYYDETVGGGDTGWQFEGGELIGQKQNRVGQNAILSRGSEHLLHYHRPMLEDGTIEYEFYYHEGKSQTHPALGRLAFVLDRRGVRIHWVTDGEYDRTGLDPLNMADEPLNRRGPAELPFKEEAWNRVRLSLAGNTVQLSLNDQEIYERELEVTNQRTFGLFYDADRTEARVRDITWTGDWPRELPVVNDQELASDGTGFLDADLPNLTAVFEHDFASGGLPTNRFTSFDWIGPESQTLVVEQQDGVHVTRPGARAGYTSHTIRPRCAVKGDFDVTASFKSFEPEPSKDSKRTEFTLVLTALLRDEAQTRTELTFRHLLDSGRDDNRRADGRVARALDGNSRLQYSGRMTCDAEAGTLRLARRGKKMYFLIAEHDSPYFRLVGETPLSDADLQPDGIQLKSQILGQGVIKVVWTKIEIRATEIIDLAAVEITKLQKQLTGELPPNALEFDGRTQYVTVPSIKYDGSHPITLEAYVTYDRLPGIVVGDNQSSGLALGVLGRGDQYRMQIWGGRLYSHAVSYGPTPTNLRTHLAGTFDGERMSVFVNGKLANMKATNIRFTPSGAPLTIGGSPPLPANRLYNGVAGVIDGVRVSKTIRYTKDFQPPAELEADEQTLAVYRFDEGNGAVLADSSGNNHHGEIRGASWVGDMAIRQPAALGLAAFGPRAVPALVDALEHENPAIRLAAVNALGSMGPAAATAAPAVRKRLSDDDQRVVAAAQQAQARIAGSPRG